MLKVLLDVCTPVQVRQALSGHEVQWSPRRVSGRAFRDAYGVEVEPIRPDNPFAVDIFKTLPATATDQAY